ncbi:ester cyclase [Shimia sp.]|uniref:ester cyclase n=1 Tax=Shimia sp. TaxID=1954381 RepID=UPI003BAB240F
MTVDKQQIIKDWFRRVWIEQDMDAIDEMFRPDSTAEGVLPGFGVGPDDFREMATMYLALVEDPIVTVDKVMDDGDWAAALWTMSIANPTGGDRIKGFGQLFVRFEGKVMVEAYNNFDMVGFFQQLGLLPEQTIALCLTGQKVA